MGYYALNATLKEVGNNKAGKENKVRILEARHDMMRCIDAEGKRCQHRVVERYSACETFPWPGVVVEELEVLKPKSLRIKAATSHSATYVLVLINNILNELESDILEVKKAGPKSRITQQELEACDALIYIDLEPMKLVGPRPTYRPLQKLTAVSCYDDDIFVLSTEVVIDSASMAGRRTSYLRSSTIENFIREITVIDYATADTSETTKFSRSLSSQADAIELLKSSVSITEPGNSQPSTEPSVRSNLGQAELQIDSQDEREGYMDYMGQPWLIQNQTARSRFRKPYQHREKEFFFKELLGGSDGQKG